MESRDKGGGVQGEISKSESGFDGINRTGWHRLPEGAESATGCRLLVMDGNWA